MRDQGLEDAIRAAGGVGLLARSIGISQPSVSNWSRVPAERVLSVEKATGIDRALDALEAIERGQPVDVAAYFADLIAREPELPAHLRGSR